MNQWMLAICAAIFTGSAVSTLMSGKLSENMVTHQRLRQVQEMLRRNNSGNQKMEEPFFERIIIPLLDNLIQRLAIIIPLNENARKRLDKQLMMAGHRVGAKEYSAITAIMVVCLVLVGPRIVNFVTNKPQPAIIGIALGAYTGIVLRRFTLASAIKKRKKAIEEALPNVIDLLSVSVTSGLGFEQALGYVTERCEGVLVDEFKLLQQHLLMGRSKKDSLHALAKRCEVDEIKTFVSVIVQAEEVGIPIQNILSSQSESIRHSHRQKMEEKAAKIPVKILPPIVFFIFPAIFIVLLGPAIMALMPMLSGD